MAQIGWGLRGAWRTSNRGFSRDKELPTLAAGCVSDSMSKDPLGGEVKEGSVFILRVLGSYQGFLTGNYV